MKASAHEVVKYATSLRSQAITVATVNGLAVNRAPGAGQTGELFEEALVVIDVGPLGGTTPTLTVNVDDAPDNGAGSPGTWAAVAGATFPVFNATDDDRVLVGRLDLQKRRKFLRLTAVGAGTTPTGSFHGGFVLLAAKEKPVTQTAAVAFNV